MTKILVDTSIWIEYFKANKEVLEIIHDRKNYEIFIAGPIITELIQGLKTEKEKAKFSMCIDAIPKLPLNDTIWVDAGNYGNTLRRSGVTIPLADLIIFTMACKYNCSLFSLDKHFKIIKDTIKNDFDLIRI